MICKKEHRYLPLFDNLPDDQGGQGGTVAQRVLLKEGIKMD